MKDLSPDDELTPSEAIAEFPELRRMSVRKEDFGVFRRTFVVPGFRENKNKSPVMKVKYIVRLIRYITENHAEFSATDLSKYDHLMGSNGEDHSHR